MDGAGGIGTAGALDASRFNLASNGIKPHPPMPLINKLLTLWWALQDSNLRLPPCEGGDRGRFC